MDSREGDIEKLIGQVAALTGRVYKLERALGAAAPSSEAALHVDPATLLRQEAIASEPAGPPSPPGRKILENVSPPPAGSIPRRPGAADVPPSPRPHSVSFESRLGGNWLNRLGIAALIIGTSYFLKYAFDNQWVGASGRVGISVMAGIAFTVWGDRICRRGLRSFGYSVVAAGIGILYVALWAAFQMYHLIPAGAAFSAMAAVTASAVTLALSRDAEVLAAIALAGGFATPALVSTGQNHEGALFAYLALLDAGMLILGAFRWRRLLCFAYAGTAIYFVAWYATYYTVAQRPATFLVATFLAMLFATVPLISSHSESSLEAGISRTLVILPILNAFAYAGTAAVLFDGETNALTFIAIGLGIAYLSLGWAIRKRIAGEHGAKLAIIHFLMALGFLTAAIPIKLNGEWIAIGWTIEGAVLLLSAARTRLRMAAMCGAGALLLGILHLIFLDTRAVQPLLLNGRFVGYLLAISVLAGLCRWSLRNDVGGSNRRIAGIASILLNLLALMALCWEASDYYARHIAASGLLPPTGNLGLARDFTYSAIWLVYSAALIAVGFHFASAWLRWQGLALVTLTAVKVFLYDVSVLETMLRVMSFMALGGVLMLISYVYQRSRLGGAGPRGAAPLASDSAASASADGPS